MKSKCLSLLPICLLITSQANATSSDNEYFRAATTRAFVQNTITGTWDTDCTVEENSNTSFQSIYEFDDFGAAKLTTRRYEDSACVMPAQAQSFSGTLTLNGVKVNSYGQYVYELQVTAADGEAHILLVQMSFDDALTLSLDRSSSSFLVTRSLPGVAQ
jgi:hypothetical protein